GECRSSLFAKPISFDRSKVRWRRRPRLLRQEASDFAIRIDRLSRHRLPFLIECKPQLVRANGELSASHRRYTRATPARHAVVDNESCRLMRLFVPPDADELL